MGITQKALAFGVPVCVVPWARDQLDVAAHVEEAGRGREAEAPEPLPCPTGRRRAGRGSRAPGAARVKAGYKATGGGAAGGRRTRSPDLHQAEVEDRGDQGLNRGGDGRGQAAGGARPSCRPSSSPSDRSRCSSFPGQMPRNGRTPRGLQWRRCSTSAIRPAWSTIRGQGLLGHPEQPERLRAIEAALAERDWLGWERREAPAASERRSCSSSTGPSTSSGSASSAQPAAARSTPTPSPAPPPARRRCARPGPPAR